MQPFITLSTASGLQLPGLWLTSQPEQAFVFVHGFGSSAFSHLGIRLHELLSESGSFLLFQNQGAGSVTRLKKIDTSRTAGFRSVNLGSAHENFADSVNDLEAAYHFAKEHGAKRVIFIGHSTGAQKVGFFCQQKCQQRSDIAAVYLSPLCDRAIALSERGETVLQEKLTFARKKVQEQAGNVLLPADFWPVTMDAQRFISLFEAESPEQIFSYEQGGSSTALRQVSNPTCAILAREDEYSDRPAGDIAQWFLENLSGEGKRVEILAGDHSFTGQEALVARTLLAWLESVPFTAEPADESAQ